MHDDFSAYSSKLFIDANVILEGRPIQALPWSEIDATGPILVVITPRVLSEIDSKKNDKRLGTRARDFNRLVAPLVLSDTPVAIGDSALRVDLVLATCAPIEWEAYDDLDRAESDDRIVAEVLATQRLPDDEKVFVSQDINPLMKARRHGLRVYRVDARWLPEPLPSPDATEIAQLKQKLEMYQRSEPEFEAQLSIEPATVKLFRVRQLEQTDRSHLKSRILSRNPRQSQDHLRLTGLFFDHTFDSRYSRYVEKVVPEFCDDFHKLLEIQFNQVVYKIRLKNAG